MCVPGASSRMKTEGVSEVESAKDKAFSTIAEPQAKDVRVASINAGDGATFVSLEREKQSAPSRRALAR